MSDEQTRALKAWAHAVWAMHTARHRDRHLNAAYTRNLRERADDWREEAYQMEKAPNAPRACYLLDMANRLEAGMPGARA